MNLLIIFFTGLTTGGLTCLAVQGGLLASIIANQKENELETKKTNLRFDLLDWLPVTLFLISKLAIHTILGFLLGWLGSKVELSVGVRLVFQTLAALFMLATAGNLLQLHPIFRYVVFQPPRFIQKRIRSTTKSKALFTPAILGLFTVFMPCGVTQAMEVLAMTSGSPWLGAAIMFTFVLGTSPLFATVGVATAKLSETFSKRFLKLAAVLLVVLAVMSLNGVLLVLNSPITLNTFTKPITYFFSDERFNYAGQQTSPTVTNGIQEVSIQVNANGYSPRRLTVKAGIPVKLTLHSTDAYSCASYFILKAFNIKAQLGANDTQSFTFTPTQKGKFPYTCAMGMYTGTLEVI